MAHYKFDGNADDSSVNGFHLTENGTPTYPGGHEGGQAIDLEGDDDSAVYRFTEETWAAYTVTVWVRTDTLGQAANSSVFSGYHPASAGFQFAVDGTNPGSYRYNGSFTSLLGSVTTDWVDLPVVCDGTLLAEARTILACVNAEGKVRRVPEFMYRE